MGLFSAIDDFLFGSNDDWKQYAMLSYYLSQKAINNAEAKATKDLEEGKSKAQSYLDAVDTTRKTAEQLYNEGRGVAGQAAVDKAGIAKREAKAASTMAGASKLFGAIQGAQAATDAVIQGYDEAAQSAASTAQAQEAAQKEAEMQKATSQAALESGTAQQKASTALNAGQMRSNSAQQTGSTLSGTSFNQGEGLRNRVSGFLGNVTQAAGGLAAAALA